MNKSDLSLIKKTVQQQLQKHFQEQSPFFIVGVSGGMDSMALLSVFKQLELPVLVSHVNYGKRGKASEGDEALVQEVAERWGMEWESSTLDPSEAEGKNFQQWARQARYDIFYRQLKERGAQGIALAHHRDDQIETVLQKLFRGAGLESWGGMDVWDRKLFRPLLRVSRNQIEQYVKEQDIPYRTDASNLTSDFARNFLRNEWLQELEAFFPGWKQNILRIEKQAEDYSQALHWISRQVSDDWGLRRSAFNTLESGVQKALLLHIMKKEYPGSSVSNESLERLEQLEELETGKKIQLTDQLSLYSDRNHYILKSHAHDAFKPVTLSREELRKSTREAGPLMLSVEPFSEPDFTCALYMDIQRLSWPLTLRRWHRGDQFVPFGMKGHQQVSDHLTNRKVSAAYKNQAMVIESFEETICAVIFPHLKNNVQPGTIAEPVKCEPETQLCLKITYRN